MKALAPILIGLALSACAACASAQERGSSKAGIAGGVEGEGISRAELQDALFRFEMSFNESLREAFLGPETKAAPELRTQALRNHVTYASSALAIALGPVPESNLLDMMVFLELCRAVFARHWMPTYYGRSGAPILAAFDAGREDLAKVATKVLTPAQIGKFRDALERWSATHPEQVAVEGIRMSRIAALKGAEAAEIQRQASGMLASIKGATLAADQMVMLGERFLHYSERIPFLLRAQARLGAQEVTADLAGDPAGLIAAIRAFFGDGREMFGQAQVVLGQLTRDLADLRRLGGRIEAGYDRLILKLVLAGMALILFAAFVFLGARLLASRLAPRYSPPGALASERARTPRWPRRTRSRALRRGA